jgi:hypothetical protein
MIGAYMPPSIRGKGCPQHEFSSRWNPLPWSSPLQCFVDGKSTILRPPKESWPIWNILCISYKKYRGSAPNHSNNLITYMMSSSFTACQIRRQETHDHNQSRLILITFYCNHGSTSTKWIYQQMNRAATQSELIALVDF